MPNSVISLLQPGVVPQINRWCTNIPGLSLPRSNKPAWRLSQEPRDPFKGTRFQFFKHSVKLHGLGLGKVRVGLVGDGSDGLHRGGGEGNQGSPCYYLLSKPRFFEIMWSQQRSFMLWESSMMTGPIEILQNGSNWFYSLRWSRSSDVWFPSPPL